VLVLNAAKRDEDKMGEQKNVGLESRRGSGVGVVAALLSVLVIGAGCASHTNNRVSSAANGIQKAANGLTDTVNAVNGAADAVGKTFNTGSSTNGGTGSPSTLAPSTRQAGPARACAIDDMADGNNQILSDAGRGGYWYSYVDSAGSTITPAAGTPFTMSPVTAPNLPAFAARFSGNVANGQILYAGIGFNLTQPKGAYDASQYTGVSFWAKAAAGSAKNVRFKIPDVNTDPDGKVCTGCYNDFGVDLVLTESFHQYVIRFADMTQLSGWGAPRVAHITPAALFGMQWQVAAPGTSYDMTVSNVAFTGCQ